jgi:hypothetical protein
MVNLILEVEVHQIRFASAEELQEAWQLSPRPALHEREHLKSGVRSNLINSGGNDLDFQTHRR